MSSKVVCTFTPPEGQDINIYLVRLMAIIDQLNTQKKKDITRERVQLLIDDINRILEPPKK
jgi:hypothetical protein